MYMYMYMPLHACIIVGLWVNRSIVCKFEGCGGKITNIIGVLGDGTTKTIVSFAPGLGHGTCLKYFPQLFDFLMDVPFTRNRSVLKNDKMHCPHPWDKILSVNITHAF